MTASDQAVLTVMTLAVVGTYAYCWWSSWRSWQSDLMTALDEAICFHSVLISMGFDAKDIYLTIDSGRVVLLLAAQDKRFNIGCGVIDAHFTDAEQIVKAWADHVMWWYDSKTTPAARGAIHKQSFAHQHLTQLIDSLLSLGFKIPNATQLRMETEPKVAAPAPKPEEPAAPLSFPMSAPKGVVH